MSGLGHLLSKDKRKTRSQINLKDLCKTRPLYSNYGQFWDIE